MRAWRRLFEFCAVAQKVSQNGNVYSQARPYAFAGTSGKIEAAETK
jgi:hypothetical protein